MDNKQNRATRTLHWIMALLLITIITIGFYMTYAKDFEIYSFHKSLGVTALIFLVARLYWRFKQPWQSVSVGTKHQKIVHVTHVSLLTLTAMMLFTGIVYSGFSGYGVALFGLEIIPTNFVNGTAVPFHGKVTEFGKAAHGIVAYIFSAIIVLHLAAALKHHFIDKDNTLKRMLGQ